MKHIFIVNPAAGKCDRTVQIKETVAQLLGGRGLDYEVLVSKGPGDCIRLAKEAAETGEMIRLYACGGDGTLNEVINGSVGYDNVEVTHFPAGSGNDFVKLFDRPQLFRNLENLLDCETAQLDLIECRTDEHTCYCANIVSIGLDARIAAQMGQYRRLPLVTGNGAYYMSILSNLCKGISRPFQIMVNGEVISGEKTMVSVCNGRFYGGSFNPVPDAEPDDGMLDVLIVEKVNVVQVAQIIGKYQAGKYREFPDLIRHIRTDCIEIVTPTESVLQLDGEALCASDITMKISEHKLRFFYPRGASYRVCGQEMAASAK
ncbi:MAG: YegS/Rv2252/BmrU family lipid kinase [Oscillospiraceae bacterium]|nr:YegS/Rv2252/BmrU family lipid kinase [Oscillospiraceae bacterium]